MSSSSVHQSFYRRIGENEYETTPATTSPWDQSMQHGGPPTALLAHAIDATRPDGSQQIARITSNFLGSIPQGVVRTETEVMRRGKRVEQVAARLFSGDQLVVTADAWRIAVGEGSTAQFAQTDPVPALPDAQEQRYFDGVDPDWGYGRAIEWRFISGGYNEAGAMSVWARLQIPLVAGELTSPISQLLVVADSMNGLSAEIPLQSWFSIPPTMNATIVRPPTSEWMLFNGESRIGPNGIGIARGQAFDQSGFIAEIAQPLFVAPRQ